MKITILGSGGFTPTPLPNCHCENCKQARSNHELARTGPAIYINDIDLLIDTPADSYRQLDRLGKFPKNIAYSHWHPDHTEGWRALEFFNNIPNVYIQENSLISDRVPGLKFLDSQDKIKNVDWNESTPIKTDDMQISYFVLDKNIPVYGFILKNVNGKTAVIVPDHSKFLLDLELGIAPDLLVMNLGMKDTQRNVTTLQDNIDIIKKMKPKKVILTHIEATFDLTDSQISDLKTTYNAAITRDGQEIEI